MRNAGSLRRMWGYFRRHWYAWRARLRRDQAALALGVLLMLGLGEPLLCILHCQLWLPFAHHSYFSAQHQHQHHAGAAGLPGTHVRQAGAVLPSPARSDACTLIAAGSGVPLHVPPTPVHDMLTTLVLIAITLRLLCFYLGMPRGAPPPVPTPPLLRPPIAIG